MVPESGVQPCKYGEGLAFCSKRPESMMGYSRGHDVIAYICEAVGIHTLIFYYRFFLICLLVKGHQQEYPEEQRSCFKRTLSLSIFKTIVLPFTFQM